MSAIEIVELGCRIDGAADLLRVRQLLRELTFASCLVDQTKLITAASELARNILMYAGPSGGRMDVEQLEGGLSKRGLRAVFTDEGPGITDVQLAMKDGYSTSSGLGLGLPGARRLVDDFSIRSAIAGGTTVTILKWLR